MVSISNQVAVAGLGATEFSKNSGRSELRLAAEAVLGALADAGIAVGEVDGLATIGLDNNSPYALARTLGLDEVRFFAHVPGGGGGGCGSVSLGAAAIVCEQADVVVCYRAMNERSQVRFGTPGFYGQGLGGAVTSDDIDASWLRPFGMMTPAAYIAPSARRYMHDYGVTSEDFGRAVVAARAYAATNPAAHFYGKPITLEDHQDSRMIADPLRLFDCCQESDGAVAIVLTSLQRARSLRRPPVVISGAAQGIGPRQVGMASPYREDIVWAAETALIGRELFGHSGLTPDDMDAAILYDHFSPAVLMQLEALGFCDIGEAPDYIRDGNIGPGGKLPVNTNGGQVGEAYIHGFNGIAEAVRQVRGTAVNQVADVDHVLVTSGSHVPTSGLILSRAS